MISNEDLLEVRSRDFLSNINHYRDFDYIKTNYVFGNKVKNAYLTIIVPYYDHPIEFAKRAINSVLYQKCDYVIQILVIDDNAQRNGMSDLEIYLRKISDSRIIYYKNEKNLGVFANWNRAIELSDSEWITILHTDDFYKENYLNNMLGIVQNNSDIDQLACNYKLLNFLKQDIDIDKEFQGEEGCRTLRKVKYTEYYYDMITSVKGSLYKRSKLINIGGFRNQGNGIGLDDYPLMLRFAYYYNTYLLEDILYLDSWGYNDSLNTKHWFPELVENYYMWLYFANKEKGILRYLYKKRAVYLLSYRAKQYSDGTSWLGIPIDIDFEELKNDCELKRLKNNWFCKKANGLIIKTLQLLKKYPINKYKVYIKAQKRLSKLR